MSMDNIPEELRTLPRWVCFKFEPNEKKGKPDKVPYQANYQTHRASSTRSDTWASFEDARISVENGWADGLAFILTEDDPYTGVDFDDCVNGGHVHKDVQELVQQLDTYTEQSVSETGLHCIIRAELTIGRNKLPKASWGGAFEVYDRKRMFCFTGKRLFETPVQHRQAELDAICSSMFPVKETPQREPSFDSLNLTDTQILDTAFAASNGRTLRALYDGQPNGYKSASDADAALLTHLVFYTRDNGQLDRLFRSSALYREDKWEREDYRDRTISYALSKCTRQYEPRKMHTKPKPPHSDNGAKPKDEEDVFIRAADMQSRSSFWLWDGYLPIGNLVVQTGVEKIGKGVFFAWQAAGITNGRLAGDFLGKPSNILVIADEDDLEETWLPRLTLAGADLDRVFFLDPKRAGEGWNIHDNIDHVTAKVQREQAKLVFVDALLEKLPATKGNESINSAPYARKALAPIRRAAKSLKFVGQYSLHPPKGKMGEFRDSVQGSHAFTAVPRVGLEFAYHPEDDESDPLRRRLFMRGVANIGRQPKTLSFQVTQQLYKYDDGLKTEQREVVVNVKPCAVTRDSLIERPEHEGGRKRTKQDEIQDILLYELIDREWHYSVPIVERLTSLGYSSGTISYATRGLGIEIEKRDKRSMWRLPESASARR